MRTHEGSASKRRRRRRDGWRTHPHLYRVWRCMLNRCNNPRLRAYPRYGGRGIRVCRRWRSFAAFMSDMGDPPTPLHTLERIDNDGSYSHRNCRWATRREQANNRRSNRRLTFGGRTLTLAEWAAEVGISQATIGYRCRRGWPAERILSTAPRPWSPGKPRAAS